MTTKLLSIDTVQIQVFCMSPFERNQKDNWKNEMGNVKDGHQLYSHSYFSFSEKLKDDLLHICDLADNLGGDPPCLSSRGEGEV